jgi:hypothetical protein
VETLPFRSTHRRPRQQGFFRRHRARAGKKKIAPSQPAPNFAQYRDGAFDFAIDLPLLFVDRVAVGNIDRCRVLRHSKSTELASFLGLLGSRPDGARQKTVPLAPHDMPGKTCVFRGKYRIAALHAAG